MSWGKVPIGQDALGYGADWSGCSGVRCRLVRMLWGTVPIGQDALGYGADWSGCPGVWCRLVRMLWGTVPIGQDALGGQPDILSRSVWRRRDTVPIGQALVLNPGEEQGGSGLSPCPSRGDRDLFLLGLEQGWLVAKGGLERGDNGSRTD